MPHSELILVGQLRVGNLSTNETQPRRRSVSSSRKPPLRDARAALSFRGRCATPELAAQRTHDLKLARLECLLSHCPVGTAHPVRTSPASRATHNVVSSKTKSRTKHRPKWQLKSASQFYRRCQELTAFPRRPCARESQSATAPQRHDPLRAGVSGGSNGSSTKVPSSSQSLLATAHPQHKSDVQNRFSDH